MQDNKAIINNNLSRLEYEYLEDITEEEVP